MVKIPQFLQPIIKSIYPRFDQSPQSLVNQQLGRPGFQYYMPGWIRKDPLPELAGRNLWLVYEEMGSNCAYCAAVLNAFAMFLRRANWHVDPMADENKEDGSAEFLESCMGDMYHSWQTIIAASSRGVPQFGFTPLEKIFKIREGEVEDTRYSSDYDDGLIGWANFAYRSPDSILHWDYDPKDVTRLIGLTQLAAPDWKTQFIPIEKLIILRAEPGKDSPEGRSVLRSAWRAWKTKKTMEDLRNVSAERGGAGIPWAEVPAHIANAPCDLKARPNDPKAIEAMSSYQSLVDTMENITQDKQKWIITPQMWDPQGNPMIKVSFLQPSQGADIIGHITASIEAEAKAILISTMTEFLALGMGGSGSLALSRDKTDNFTLAIEAYLKAFESSIHQQATKQLFRLNPRFQFGKKKPLPKIVYDSIIPLSTNDVVAMLGLFEKTGWDMSKQAGIRDAIIENLGLPSYVEDEVNATLQENGNNPISLLIDGHSALDDVPGFSPIDRLMRRRSALDSTKSPIEALVDGGSALDRL